MSSEVSVYVIDLRVSTWRALDHLLTAAERAHRDRFVFECDRQAFTVCRARLRHILGDRLGVAPREISFKLGPYGKPHVHDDAVAFNVSHSGDLGLIAISDQEVVGVDIERERSLPDFMSISRRYFSEEERAQLAKLPHELRQRAFFLCWSRKEALIKAIGMGLSFGLDQFDVELDPREAAKIKRIDGECSSTRWVLHHLTIAPRYCAALVTPSPAIIHINSKYH